MLKLKSGDILGTFAPHGVVTAGGFTYVLLVNMDGSALVQRVNADSSEIRYAVKTESETIVEFWAARATLNYKFLNQL